MLVVQSSILNFNNWFKLIRRRSKWHVQIEHAQLNFIPNFRKRWSSVVGETGSTKRNAKIWITILFKWFHHFKLFHGLRFDFTGTSTGSFIKWLWFCACRWSQCAFRLALFWNTLPQSHFTLFTNVDANYTFFDRMCDDKQNIPMKCKRIPHLF